MEASIIICLESAPRKCRLVSKSCENRANTCLIVNNLPRYKKPLLLSFSFATRTHTDACKNEGRELEPGPVNTFVHFERAGCLAGGNFRASRSRFLLLLANRDAARGNSAADDSSKGNRANGSIPPESEGDFARKSFARFLRSFRSTRERSGVFLLFSSIFFFFGFG